jgi:hypothetical protein
MKIRKRLSRSATNNPLYLAAFGKASEDEGSAKYCTPSAKALKHARRKLYNELLRTKKGFDRLQCLFRRSSNCSKEWTVDSKKISEASDDEDEGYNPQKPLFQMRRLEEIDNDMDWDSTVPGFTSCKDPEVSENDLYPPNSRKARGKGLFDPLSQPVFIPRNKRRKVEVEADDDDYDMHHNDGDEELEKIKVKKEDDGRCDYYEDEVEHILPYEDFDSDTDDEDLGRLRPKVTVKVYSNSYQAPSADDEDEDDMFSDTWSNKATAADSDNEGSNISDTDDDLEGLEYESDDEDYITDTSPLQLHPALRGLSR